MRYCNISDCKNKHLAKGYCSRHYAAWKYWGNPLKSSGREYHGMFNTPTYSSWEHMISRCNNVNNRHYSSYGGRGISVAQRWQKFTGFLEDMGERPDGMTLDRIDVNGNYEPGNCRWATKSLQQANRRASGTSGVRGVTILKDGRFLAQITKDYKHYNLGKYDSIEEARTARKNAEMELWGFIF